MRRQFCKPLVVLLVVMQIAGPASAAPPLEVLTQFFKRGRQHREPPVAPADEAVEQLARNIDWLEKQIDQWGTVVAKAPDVWGEARLTAHRQEIEQELRKELTKFDHNRISGAQFVSDQAMLAAAFALRSEPTLPTGTNRVQAPPISLNLNNTELQTAVEGQKEEGKPNIIFNNQLGTPQTLFGIEKDKHLVGETLKLEQTEVLDQLNRYLHHLASLRRINEGDDTSDAPGYSLNLIRIPVSLLPGKHSKRGYGAEITVTATPHLGPELLPMAYRDFVINDLVDQLAVPLTRFLNADPVTSAQLMEPFQTLEGINRRRPSSRPVFMMDVETYTLVSAHPNLPKMEFFTPELHATSLKVSFDNLRDYINELHGLDDVIRGAAEQAGEKIAKTEDGFKTLERFAEQTLQRQQVTHSKQTEPVRALTNKIQQTPSFEPSDKDVETLRKFYQDAQTQPVRDQSAKLLEITDEANSLLERLDNLEIVQLPGGANRRAVLPFPPTQLFENYGLHELGVITYGAYRAFEADVINRNIVHVTDAQSYLKEELAAAYEMLSAESMRQWWLHEANSQRELHQNIRLRKLDAINAYRDRFLEATGAKESITASLAWCIFVESILLNERLIQDMRETAGNRPCACDVPGWLPFFGPDPPVEARMAFNEYVKCRWPVRVFALDPVVNEQNIADISSVYRQMQMAVVLAFAGGEMGTSAALQAMRKLQRDRATVDLNRTAVAFGHGEDTFGWRFYPRFQTPPVEGNLTVLFRDLVMGGPTDRQLEHSEEIEPGMRECVAVVLMPSFVPYMTIDTRGNWFKLTNPGQTAVSVTETVEFSRSIRSMQDSAMQCVQFSHLYRNGEVERLLRRVEQLDRELPLQTLPCQVPIENTHGGFEIFSSGTRELAPELLGWYGAPGYNRMRPTRMFLAGDNFSISQSRLIVGNHEIPFRLLSRQIMEVTLPPGLPILRDKNLYKKEMNEQYDGYLDAHIATPYGVSGHLLIPVVRDTRDSSLPYVTMPATRMEVEAKYTTTGGKRSVSSTTIKTSDFPHIDALPYLGLNRPPIKVVLYPTVGNDRLAPVTIDGVAPSPDGMRYDLREKLIEQFLATGSGTRLFESLKEYSDYLLNNRPSLGDRFDVPVEVAVFVEAGKKRIPVEGNFSINLEVTD